MKLNDVVNIFEKYGFLEKDFIKQMITKEVGKDKSVNQTKVLDFDKVFVDKHEKEIYILEEKTDIAFNEHEIRQMEKKVASFIYARPNNDSIRYNINLILICPISDLNRDKVVALERNKYFCRKIFINSLLEGSDFEEEINILPFIPISNLTGDYELSGISDMLVETKKVMPQSLFEQLISDEEPKIDELESALLALCEGE